MRLTLKAKVFEIVNKYVPNHKQIGIFIRLLRTSMLYCFLEIETFFSLFTKNTIHISNHEQK